MNFSGARDYILNRLNTELKPPLFYHSVDHTLDVYDATCKLIELENLEDSQQVLLKTAALYHDSGILNRYSDHENESVKLIHVVLPGFGYSPDAVKEISRLILQTRLPQRAITLDEQILCDADLDYLGRDDFYIHSFQLQLEWNLLGVRRTNLQEWFGIQVNFLSDHRYFTKSASSLREQKKQQHLNEIKSILLETRNF